MVVTPRPPSLALARSCSFWRCSSKSVQRAQKYRAANKLSGDAEGATARNLLKKLTGAGGEIPEQIVLRDPRADRQRRRRRARPDPADGWPRWGGLPNVATVTSP